MTQLRIPGALKHTSEEQSDAALQEKGREHADHHPGLRFLGDVLRALHGPVAPLRNAKTFFSAFTPREVMDAFGQRPDLRVKLVRAFTGSPPALLRRMTAEALASQIDLLAIEDLPESERSVRAEADRALSVNDLYMRYVDPLDLATYMPQAIWTYESHDDWWKWEPSASARTLMAAELRLVRKHAILTDAEILDLLGDETLEGTLSLDVRVGLRRLSRRAAAEGRPFTDADLFAGLSRAGGTRDLIDELVECVPLPQLRQIVSQAARAIGVAGAMDDNEEPTKVSLPSVPREAVPVAAAAGVIGQRIGPKSTPATVMNTPAPMPVGAKPRPPVDRSQMTPPPKPIPPVPAAKPVRAAAAPLPVGEPEGPPQPDDDLAWLEEVSGRVV